MSLPAVIIEAQFREKGFYMKLNKLSGLVALGVALSAGISHAAVTDSAVINFSGEVVQEPCTIDSVQTVELGKYGLGAYQDGDAPEPVTVTVNFSSCSPSTANISFSGTTDPLLDGGQKWILKNTGTATGLGVSLQRMAPYPAGQIVFNGAASPTVMAKTFTAGSNTFQFEAMINGFGPNDDGTNMTGTVLAQATMEVAYN